MGRASSSTLKGLAQFVPNSAPPAMPMGALNVLLGMPSPTISSVLRNARLLVPVVLPLTPHPASVA